MSGRPGMKLGRLAPKVHAKTLKFSNYLRSDAPAPPPAKAFYEYVLPPNGWGMLGNDDIGDCTCADAGHRIMLWTKHQGELVTPNNQQVISAYSAITGYDPATGENDNGAAMTDVFEYCRTTGIAGHKIEAWVAVDFTNLLHVRQAIYLFGHLSIGVNLPESAMDQVNAGQPWDVVDPDGGIDGGHDVPIFGYGSEGFTCVTWGQLQQIGLPWFQKYVEEAYSAVSLDWLNAGGLAPNSLNMEALTADLAALHA